MVLGAGADLPHSSGHAAGPPRADCLRRAGRSRRLLCAGLLEGPCISASASAAVAALDAVLAARRRRVAGRAYRICWISASHGSRIRSHRPGHALAVYLAIAVCPRTAQDPGNHALVL